MGKLVPEVVDDVVQSTARTTTEVVSAAVSSVTQQMGGILPTGGRTAPGTALSPASPGTR